MLSAFGVDHGEISKAGLGGFRMPKPGAMFGGGAKQTGGAAAGPPKPKTFIAGQKFGAGAAKSTRKVGMAAGQGTSAVGQAMARVGGAMQRNPGRAGAAVAGGAGAGGYGLNQRRKRPPGAV